MFETTQVTEGELESIARQQEGYLLDFKAKEIKPGKAQETFVAFANSDGGDLYIGIADHKESERFSAFKKPEDANAHVAELLQGTQPAVEGVEAEFLHEPSVGYILHLVIPKSSVVHYTSGGGCYIRVNASSQKIKGDSVARLAYAKGFYKFEDVQVPDLEISDIVESPHLKDFIRRIDTSQEPERLLRRNRLLPAIDGVRRPSVACALLFDEEPQEVVPSKCSVKIIRMQTVDQEYRRSQLEQTFVMNGPIEALAKACKGKIFEIMKESTYSVGDKNIRVSYPAKAVHEILVNAILHRDYSVSADVHVTIYDNRIEIKSPGRLPGNVTLGNIRDAHFNRNPNIVRMIHRLPNPINHDLGEGLDTAFNEMRDAGLVPPEITESDDSVTVALKHQRLASYEDQIMEYLENHDSIANREARQLTGEGSENKIKRSLQKLLGAGKIEPADPNASRFNRRYRKKQKSETE